MRRPKSLSMQIATVEFEKGPGRKGLGFRDKIIMNLIRLFIELFGAYITVKSSVEMSVES